MGAGEGVEKIKQPFQAPSLSLVPGSWGKTRTQGQPLNPKTVLLHGNSQSPTGLLEQQRVSRLTELERVGEQDLGAL